MAITERLIRVEIIQHRAARMLLGISDDLSELHVQGRNEAEVEARLPGAIRAIFEAEGKRPTRVERVDPPAADPDQAVLRYSVRNYAVAA